MPVATFSEPFFLRRPFLLPLFAFVRSKRYYHPSVHKRRIVFTIFLPELPMLHYLPAYRILPPLKFFPLSIFRLVFIFQPVFSSLSYVLIDVTNNRSMSSFLNSTPILK